MLFCPSTCDQLLCDDLANRRDRYTSAREPLPEHACKIDRVCAVTMKADFTRHADKLPARKTVNGPRVRSSVMPALALDVIHSPFPSLPMRHAVRQWQH
ncbi:hypothetical protein BN2475_170038 [Paraburkholderia ribeironis]|uniref:Uncharacterized protein n=1 Tax=Paraburkholderia ribeironis TaxID=1247936 RepID=A0A1N7RUI7_9BURK|nr:hypothetical protein BN2475_170038 [Paraburkholderia ribeironis]